jgi:tetratricopeptide (TPR) repeat protein
MFNDYSCRQLIPRILPVNTSNLLSLNINTSQSSLFNTSPFEIHNYNILKEEWKSEKNNILAIEILVYEILYDSLNISLEIVDYLTKNRLFLNQIENDILSFAENKKNNAKISTLSLTQNNNPRIRIKNIKQQNKVYPLNAFQWCDLGYFYTTLGQKEKARKAYLIAISLNNSNRFIVRSVARFFLHLGEIEYGHKILTSCPRIKIDAGIITAEIAFSELMTKKSKHIDYGTKIINDDNISFFEKNELLAQIATLEYSYGKNSKGKKLLENCLTDPNENSLAQIAFLKNRISFENVNNITDGQVLFQYEAAARSYFYAANFEEAFKNAKSWFEFQPFAGQPAAYSMYIATQIIQKYQEAISIGEKVLQINNNSFTIKNNLAFAYAKDNNIEKATLTLKKINISELSDNEKAVFNATSGYIAFKVGNSKLAAIGYNEAIKYFKAIKDEISLSRAMYNYAEILKETDKEEYIRIMKGTLELSKKNNIVELIYLIEKENKYICL